MEALVTDWQFWLVLALILAVLEFVIGGVGMLAVGAAACATTCAFVLLSQAIPLQLSWRSVILVLVVSLAIAVIVVRLIWSRRSSDADINDY